MTTLIHVCRGRIHAKQSRAHAAAAWLAAARTCRCVAVTKSPPSSAWHSCSSLVATLWLTSPAQQGQGGGACTVRVSRARYEAAGLRHLGGGPTGQPCARGGAARASGQASGQDSAVQRPSGRHRTGATPALCPPKQRPHGSSEVRRQRSATCVCGRLLPAARGNGRAAAGQGRAGPAAGPGPVRRTFVQPPEQSSQLLAAILHLPLLARVPTGPRLAYLRGSGEGARGITEGRGGRRAALRCARGLRVGAT